MHPKPLTYINGSTPLHRCDARVKIVVLFAFSIAIFFAHTWYVMGAFLLAVVVAVIVGRIPVGTLLRMLVPVFLLAAFSLAFNVLPAPSVESLIAGLVIATRMVVLVAASFVVCFTTTPTELLEAFRWLIGPLRYIKVPVDDVAFTLVLALRFIPVIEEEFVKIRMAQRARGGLAAGSLYRRFLTLGAAFSALFVNLFRHAGNLATAMDARCYGASQRRSKLPKA